MSDFDAEDSLQVSRMSFGDHLEELRLHLWRAIIGLGVGMVVGFFLSQPVLDFIAAPINRELRTFHANRRQALEKRLVEGDPVLVRADQPRETTLEVRLADLGLAQPHQAEPADPAGSDWQMVRARIRPVSWELVTAVAREEAFARYGLTGLTMTEPFMVYFKVSLYCGFVLACPWIFFQFWSFVAAGLYPHEKRLVYLYLPFSIVLFLAGVALCEFIVLPVGVSYLLSYYEWLAVEPEIRLGDWLSFALVMPLVFGACFQTPLVMLLLERIGLADVNFYRKSRRMAIFLLSVLAAVVSVTPDAVNMIALAAPLWALYELGIVLCALSPQPIEEELADEDMAGVFDVEGSNWIPFGEEHLDRKA